LTNFGLIAFCFTFCRQRYRNVLHNWSMDYGTGDIPDSDYDPRRLANLGTGHGAIDFGAGYTYFNPQTGNEFSAVTGATYNFKNTSTQYQNGNSSPSNCSLDGKRSRSHS
jgi:hypothetical protein